MSLTKLLVPISGSNFSRRILPVLCRVFPPQQCELILLRVTEVPHVPGDVQPEFAPLEHIIGSNLIFKTFETQRVRDPKLDEYALYQSQVEEAVQHEIEDELDETAHCLQGYDVSIAVRFGDPAEEIGRFIDEESIDLVAMATHARAGIPQLVLGSVATEVLRHATVPVLLLRCHEQAEPSAEAQRAGEAEAAVVT
jgi:nucleotide-binding universal stress UspA family protein